MAGRPGEKCNSRGPKDGGTNILNSVGLQNGNSSQSMLKDSYLRASERRLRKGFPWLPLGLVISLGLNAYLLTRMEHQSREMSDMKQLLQSDAKALREASSSAFAAFQVDQQRFYEMKKALETEAIKTPHATQPDG